MDANQRRKLKAAAHHLKPVVIVGNKGVTTSLIEEAQRALEHHELIKVKFASTDREERQMHLAAIQSRTQAQLVGVIGKIAILYKEA